MGGKKVTSRSIKKKSGPVHPESRRALQLARIDHRTEKLKAAKSERKKIATSKVNIHLTILLLLPPDLAYIPDKAYLHSFLQSSYLDRHSEELEELLAQRRPNRPPPSRLVELQNIIQREKLEYENNLEIPDLMNEINVKLMRQWNGDTQGLGLFRFVRVSGRDQDVYEITQRGNHKELQ